MRGQEFLWMVFHAKCKLTQVRRVHNLDCRSVIVDEKTPGKTKS